MLGLTQLVMFGGWWGAESRAGVAVLMSDKPAVFTLGLSLALPNLKGEN